MKKIILILLLLFSFSFVNAEEKVCPYHYPPAECDNDDKIGQTNSKKYFLTKTGSRSIEIRIFNCISNDDTRITIDRLDEIHNLYPNNIVANYNGYVLDSTFYFLADLYDSNTRTDTLIVLKYALSDTNITLLDEEIKNITISSSTFESLDELNNAFLSMNLVKEFRSKVDYKEFDNTVVLEHLYNLYNGKSYDKIYKYHFGNYIYYDVVYNFDDHFEEILVVYDKVNDRVINTINIKSGKYYYFFNNIKVYNDEYIMVTPVVSNLDTLEYQLITFEGDVYKKSVVEYDGYDYLDDMIIGTNFFYETGAKFPRAMDVSEKQISYRVYNVRCQSTHEQSSQILSNNGKEIIKIKLLDNQQNNDSYYCYCLFSCPTKQKSQDVLKGHNFEENACSADFFKEIPNEENVLGEIEEKPTNPKTGIKDYILYGVLLLICVTFLIINTKHITYFKE